jgi:serine/threonine protein phosphatase 1
VSVLSSESAGSASAAPVLPLGLRVYAIGDLHGRFDLLRKMAALIRADLAERPPPRRTVEVFLGDYIDRGPQSREVVEWLIGTPPLANERICLLGNHEDMLLDAMVKPDAFANWLHNGGDATLASYGVNIRPFAGRAKLAEGGAQLADSLPARHREFFESLLRMADFEPYLFVHAGIRPACPLADQDPEDLIWIRAPFLNSSADFGRVVVHGHTPVERPEVRPNRINLDTGAYFSGRLTCLALEGTSRRFLQVGAA